jgi:AraC-like DNA-binding protein
MKRFEPLPSGILSPYSRAEIASIVGCNPSTLTRRFAQAIKRGRATGTPGTVREGAAR